ncbi:hypothetical protein ACIOHC_11335 [Streptomyces sp. NPDC088252]|uniref:hypothetical protein n=1 Tax=unclassified Streptomyces TaxID=2593676 RepID=UPI00382A40D0
MPWVRLDDRFPTHRKVALLSDRAFRLYVSALCWASENLTEGRILDRELTLVARIRGPKTVAAELESAGLWDRTEDGWEIHDYLEYNPDRARVKADRAANASRQKAFRDRKKAEREAARNGEHNASRNGVTDEREEAPGDTNEARRRHDGDTNTSRSDPTNNTSSQVNEVRNAVSNAAPSPSPTQVLPSEVPPPPTPSYDTPGAEVATVSGRGEVQPLIDAMGARQMRVSWSFSAAEWLELRDAIRRVGVPALVDHAARSWTAAKNTPYSARYFLAGWTGLQDAPQYTGPRSLTAGPPSKTTEYLEDMAAIAEELRQRKMGGA